MNVLVINTGSSTVKFGLVASADERVLVDGLADWSARPATFAGRPHLPRAPRLGRGVGPAPLRLPRAQPRLLLAARRPNARPRPRRAARDRGSPGQRLLGVGGEGWDLCGHVDGLHAAGRADDG